VSFLRPPGSTLSVDFVADFVVGGWRLAASDYSHLDFEYLKFGFDDFADESAEIGLCGHQLAPDWYELTDDLVDHFHVLNLF